MRKHFLLCVVVLSLLGSESWVRLSPTEFRVWLLSGISMFLFIISLSFPTHSLAHLSLTYVLKAFEPASHWLPCMQLLGDGHYPPGCLVLLGPYWEITSLQPLNFIQHLIDTLKKLRCNASCHPFFALSLKLLFLPEFQVYSLPLGTSFPTWIYFFLYIPCICEYSSMTNNILC